jgi:hypothetical protein
VPDFSNTRRVPRYSFDVDVEVADLQSEMCIREKTKDLSLYGCGIDTSVVLPRSRVVRIKIAYEGATMVALGRVVYARPDIGMGVAFISVEPEDQRILERWIGERAEEEACEPLPAPQR